MEADDEVVFLVGEVASLQIRAEVIDPTEPAALATSKQTGSFGERPPAAFAVGLDVADEAVVLLLGPSTFVGVLFLATRRPSHVSHLEIERINKVK